jgi:alkanesulfonate monooxygenase SsuD/methylene tetrahydromethanopterin reductase-like flavin-dependent oxidoreductase (luciferase family)
MTTMEVGIGLPSTVPGTAGPQLTGWARQADASGFSSLGTIDRVVYPDYDPLIALSAAAAVTRFGEGWILGGGARTSSARSPTGSARRGPTRVGTGDR